MEPLPLLAQDTQTGTSWRLIIVEAALKTSAGT